WSTDVTSATYKSRAASFTHWSADVTSAIYKSRAASFPSAWRRPRNKEKEAAPFFICGWDIRAPSVFFFQVFPSKFRLPD
ncbi:MAG: hypothetical protein ABI977_18220, partial [Acidobacteriota bacterium]